MTKEQLRDAIRQVLVERVDPYSSSLSDEEADKIINLVRDADDPVLT